MQQDHFDPFKHRFARDIRNNLSKSFLKALAAKDATIFQRCGDHYLQQQLPTDYERYVMSRMRKYEAAFTSINQKTCLEILRQAAAMWDQKLYFEMHELLEPLWQEATDNRRKALQGLIRAAGMKVHAANSNMKAAAGMAAKAKEALLVYGGELAGFENLAAVMAAIDQTLAAVNSDAPDG